MLWKAIQLLYWLMTTWQVSLGSFHCSLPLRLIYIVRPRAESMEKLASGFAQKTVIFNEPDGGFHAYCDC